MTQEQTRIIRACLAALARRTAQGLVIRYDEIDFDFPEDEIRIVSDDDAECVRITEVQR